MTWGTYLYKRIPAKIIDSKECLKKVMFECEIGLESQIQALIKIHQPHKGQLLLAFIFKGMRF